MTSSDIASRAREIYEKQLKPLVARGNEGRYIVIDVDSGDYELGDDYIVPTERLYARHTKPLLHTLKIGQPVAGRIGGRVSPANR